jgi:hypothetical protein
LKKAAKYRYRLFGITVDSEIELPQAVDTDLPADVTIEYGDFEKTIKNPIFSGIRFQVGETDFLLQVDGVAYYYIENGNKITVSPFPNASESDIKVFLLSTCFGALVHQRGMLPIHGSAVEFNGKAVVFSGVSGVGKSTIAMALQKKGFPIIADDMCVVKTNADGKPILYPGYSQTKLWADSLNALEIKSTNLNKVRETIQKFSVPVEKYKIDPLEIHTIYSLTPSNRNKIEITNLKGVEKFNWLNVNTYRYNFIKTTEGLAIHFKHITAVASRCNIKQVIRPQKGFLLNELTDAIINDLA